MSSPATSKRGSDTGMSTVANKSVVSPQVGFAVAIAVSLAVSVLAVVKLSQFNEEARWVDHTHQAMRALEDVQAATVAAQSGSRGYVVSGRERFLPPYRDALSRIGTTMDRLTRLMQDNPAQLARAEALRPRIEDQLSYFEELAGLVKSGNVAAAQIIVGSGRGEDAMGDIHRRIREMSEVEEALLVQRSRTAERGGKVARILVVGGAILSFLMLLGAYFALRREVARAAASAAAAHDANAFLDKMFESVPHILYVKSVPEFRYMRVNRAHEEMFAIPRDLLVGKRDAELFAAPQAQQIEAEDRAALTGTGVFDTEVDQLVSPGRGVRTLHKKKVIIPNAQGEPMYLLGIAEDVTEHRQAQHEIARLNETLHRRARELEITNKELEAFTYSVSHDLRAPLRAINGFALMLSEDYGDRLDEEGKRLLGVVRANAQRMGDLIDDLLAFSRIGRAVVHRVEVDMNALVASVLTELGEPAESVMPPCEVGVLPPVVGDPMLLKQVWTNLIANAVKYSGKSAAPRVEVVGERINGECIYRVADNGAGFDMRYADKLFGVFQRLHRADEFPGTGVGLAIVQRIVVRHGGRVWAEGKVNEGATFHFALPIEETVHG